MIFITDPSKGGLPIHHGNQAIKKPGLNKGSAGITSVPGLFSELFNVAASRPAQMTTVWVKASPGRPFRQGAGMVNRPMQASRSGRALARSRAIREDGAIL